MIAIDRCARLCAAWVFAVVVALPASAQFRDYTNDPALFGKLNQRTLPQPLGDVACGPVSVVNSLAYLQRQFPVHYGTSLIPDLNTNGRIDAAELSIVAQTLAQPAYMDTRLPIVLPPPRPPGSYEPNAPYYDPNTHGYVPPLPMGQTAGGTTFENFAWGKGAYLGQPNLPRTTIRGKYVYPWTNPTGGRPKPAWMQDAMPIDESDIAGYVAKGWDLEIGFTWQRKMGDTWVEQGSGHFVTVHGFQYDDMNDNVQWDPGEPVLQLHFIDPWNDNPIGPPAFENAPDLSGDLSKVGGDLFLQYNGGAVGPALTGLLRGRITIFVAEVPEPASMLLLLAFAALRPARMMSRNAGRLSLSARRTTPTA